MHSMLRIVLIPFSWLYGLGVYLRNKQFDAGLKKSVSFEIPVISVGNLSAGGTGKTPMVEYLLRFLEGSFKTGVLSRGYRRKTRGYLEVEISMAAIETGDEQLQIKRKFPDVMVAVCEERATGIPLMIAENPDLEIVILDDAFQHRQVKPGISLLITDYAHPYTRDLLLPAGRLREPAVNAKRADAIIVAKCPPLITFQERSEMAKEMAIQPAQPVFFTFQEYGAPFEIFDPDKKWMPESGDQLLLFCGIANPDSLLKYLNEKTGHVKCIKFADHHPYSLTDLKKIQQEFGRIAAARKFLITTEKDAVRLLPFKEYLLSQQLEIYCVPVQTAFFEGDKNRFDELIMSCLRSFTRRTED